MSDLVFEELILHNFKSFLGTHVFHLGRQPGLYYIAGINKFKPRLDSNGVGKTTLWDALTWILWGKTGRDRKPDSAIEPMGLDKPECWVRLKFKRKGKRYTLYRSRNPISLILIRKGEERIITQPELEKFLGMGEEMFRRSVVLAQFGGLFLDLGPEKQSQMFNEALNLDLWLRASKLAKDKLNDTNRTMTGLRIDSSRIMGRIAELRDALWREKKARIAYDTDHEANLARIARKIAAKEESIQALGKFDDENEEGKACTKKTIRRRIAALADTLREKGTDHGDACGARSAIRVSIRELLGQKQKYEDSQASDKTCPECGQKVSTGHLVAKTEALDKRLRRANSQRDSLDATINKLEADMVVLEKDIEAYRKVLDQLIELQADMKGLEREQSNLKDRENPHVEQLADLRDRIRKLRQDQEDNADKLYKLERIAARCAFWVTSFKEIRLKMIDQVLTELEMATTRHAEAMGLTDSYIEFHTERVKASGDVSTVFNTMLYMPEFSKPMKWENYSGGESQRWQLAVAFGLSEVILTRIGVNPNIEALDEPTKGMSPRGVEEMLEHLKERAVELDRAIYVTEHHSFERGLFDAVITIERTSKGSQIH